jgi:hypothetical protein
MRHYYVSVRHFLVKEKTVKWNDNEYYRLANQPTKLELLQHLRQLAVDDIKCDCNVSIDDRALINTVSVLYLDELIKPLLSHSFYLDEGEDYL